MQNYAMTGVRTVFKWPSEVMELGYCCGQSNNQSFHVTDPMLLLKAAECVSTQGNLSPFASAE
jgi:hypothetical protein